MMASSDEFTIADKSDSTPSRPAFSLRQLSHNHSALLRELNLLLREARFPIWYPDFLLDVSYPPRSAMNPLRLPACVSSSPGSCFTLCHTAPYCHRLPANPDALFYNTVVPGRDVGRIPVGCFAGRDSHAPRCAGMTKALLNQHPVTRSISEANFRETRPEAICQGRNCFDISAPDAVVFEVAPSVESTAQDSIRGNY
jgi:hypothetical protein